MTQPLQSSTCLHCLHLFSKQAITQASLLLTVFWRKGFYSVVQDWVYLRSSLLSAGSIAACTTMPGTYCDSDVNWVVWMLLCVAVSLFSVSVSESDRNSRKTLWRGRAHYSKAACLLCGNQEQRGRGWKGQSKSYPSKRFGAASLCS